ncbi:MarR family winged helix-turn-helix transcriptional regulator [Clostridium paridis]|uniref:MarR family transcriptional regulator n=1 Tax=Clostridium paridis TaxID=2803863 RepID=A0A937FEJ1_9CLOT|nr:MarR family transcriptional regulator [Clostridium paridis]MBL4931879.1 MarR family transcriptional regulator [Clostridium paridis]
MNDDEKLILAKEILETFLRFKKMHMEESKPKDIKKNECILLMLIDDRTCPGSKGIKVSELSTILDITPAAVTHMINSLEQKDYLERLSDKTDRRIVLIRPTDAGKQAIESMKTRLFNSLNELISFLGEKDSKELVRISNLVINFHKQRT